jgi:Type IV secretory pathway, VirD4 components
MSRTANTLIAAGLIVIGVWAATQYVAFRFAYDPALTGRLLTVGDVAVYPPGAVFSWWFAWGARFPQIFGPAGGIIAITTVAATAFRFVTVLRRKGAVRTFGDRVWGTAGDVKRAGLFAPSGIVLGRMDRRLLVYDGDGHVLVTGAARSGKGAGLVIPTLLTWPASVVAYDIKGELWEYTAGFRGRHTRTLFFNPTDPRSVRFNPLLEVRRGANEIRDVQNIATILIDPSSTKEQYDVWDQNARQLLVALILHVLYAEPDERKTLARVRELLMDIDGAVAAMATTCHRIGLNGEPEPHPEVHRTAMALASKTDRIRSSVQVTAEGYLELYADPVVCANTARSDFRIGDLMCETRPMSLYLIPPASDTERLRPLIRLLLNQIGRALLEDLKRDNTGREKRHRLLLLIDEFPSLGKLSFLETIMQEMPGYGLKAMLVTQSINAITKSYGRDNVIIDNCEIVTAFASQDTETQGRVSRMVGEAVELRETQSLRGSRFGLFLTQKSINQQEVRRPILDEGQVRTLPADDELIFVRAQPPFRVKRLRYYRERLFQARVLPPPPQPAATPTVNPWSGVRPDDPPRPRSPKLLALLASAGDEDRTAGPPRRSRRSRQAGGSTSDRDRPRDRDDDLQTIENDRQEDLADLSLETDDDERGLP